MDTQQQKQDVQSLYSSDLPATNFFLHLSAGTKFFHNMDFGKAISEWQEASKLRSDFAEITMFSEAASFRSNLDDIPLVGLLYTLFSNAQTGVAAVLSDYAQKEVFFKDGWIVSARTTKSEERLGNFLLRRDLIAPSKLEAMANRAKKDGVKLGTFLVKTGLLTGKELLELLDFQIKEILCDLFEWKDGEFYFEKQTVGEEDVVVGYTPLDVALLAARRRLDFATFRKMIPNNKIIFRIPPYIERDKTGIIEELNVNERFIFSLIDGNRNIAQLIKFSGDDEISIINILYRLVLMGLIKKSRDIGTYEDYSEITRFLRTFLELLKMVQDDLRKELGVMAEEVLDRARENLRGDYDKIFHGISLNSDISLDVNKIIKNISANYPSPSDRLIFIDGFYGFMNNILQEMKQILGKPMTKEVTEKIGKVRGDVYRFDDDSPAKSKVVDVLDKLVAQLSG
jgi:hypothetical protein